MNTYNYDAQIKRLTENPSYIPIEWSNGMGLFKVIGPQTRDLCAGCLTTIRTHNPMVMDKAYINGEYNEQITREIRADERIPKNKNNITVEMLPVFKEWQERIDKLQNS